MGYFWACQETGDWKILKYRCLPESAARQISVLSAGLLLLSVVYPAFSATWNGSSGVRLEFGFVENSTGSGNTSQQASSFIVEPFYHFTRVSRVQTLQGRLGVQQQQFSDDGGQSTTPSVGVDSRITLVERGMWFHSGVNASSRSVSSTGFTGDTPVSESQTDTALQLQLGPEFTKRLSDGLQLNTRAGLSRTQISGDSANVSQDNTSFGVESRLLWALGRRGNLLSLDGRFQETNFDVVIGDARIASLSLSGVTPVSQRLDTYARVGYDWIDIEELAGAEIDSEIDEKDNQVDLGGAQYAVGLRWRPDRRFELNAEYGERAFGRQPAISMLLKSRRSQLEFRWTRNLQITQLVDTQFQGTQSLSVSAGQSQGAEEEGGEISQGASETCDFTQSSDCESTPFISDLRSIDESIAATYTLLGRVSSLSFTLERTELTTLNDDNRREVDAAEFVLERLLYRNVNATLTGRLSRSASGNESELSNDSRSILGSLTWLSR